MALSASRVVGDTTRILVVGAFRRSVLTDDEVLELSEGSGLDAVDNMSAGKDGVRIGSKLELLIGIATKLVSVIEGIVGDGSELATSKSVEETPEVSSLVINVGEIDSEISAVISGLA